MQYGQELFVFDIFMKIAKNDLYFLDKIILSYGLGKLLANVCLCQ